MAKAKKSESESAAKSAEASRGKAVRKPPARKAAKPTARAGTPLIDTSLAAQAAAKMVAHRNRLNSPPGEKRESSAFKQLKQNLTNPIPHGPGGLLQNPPPQRKGNLPLGGRNQVGHNQTFGPDVTRTGVPRRTGG